MMGFESFHLFATAVLDRLFPGKRNHYSGNYAAWEQAETGRYRSFIWEYKS